MLYGFFRNGTESTSNESWIVSWANPEEAAEELESLIGDEAYKPRTVISPAEARKAVKKLPAAETVEDLIVTTRGKSFARTDDPKPAITIATPQEVFDNAEENPIN